MKIKKILSIFIFVFVSLSSCDPKIPLKDLTVGQVENIYVGDNYSVKLSFSPENATNKKVLYKSSNDSVFTVDNGIITAVGVGNATLTVTSEERSSISKEVAITVIARPVYVQEIVAGDATFNIADGATAQLVFSYLPATATEKNFNFTSSDLTVLTINNTGNMTFLKDGTSTVKISVMGVNNVVVEKNVVITINPASTPVYVQEIVASNATFNISDGTTAQLVFSYLPATATEKNFTFTSSDLTVLTINNTGNMTFLKDGTSTVKISVMGAGNVLVEKSVVITIKPIALPAPEKGNAVVANGRTILNWSPVVGAASYEVFQATEDNFASATSIGNNLVSTELNVPSLTNGTTYYFWIKGNKTGLPQADSLKLSVAPNSETVTIGSDTYTHDRTFAFNEAGYSLTKIVASTIYLTTATGSLIQNGGTGFSGSSYDAQEDNAGANSRLKLTLPDDIKNSLKNYRYVEVEMATKTVGATGDGFSLILKAGDNATGISYELIHYNNNPAAWFISYGGEWRNNGKTKKFHAGLARTVPKDTATHKFGLAFATANNPANIKVSYDRGTASMIAKATFDGGDAATGPTTFDGKELTFEFIFCAKDCPAYQVQIDAIRFFK